MNSLQPDSVAIHRLRIHGAAGLEHASRQLRRELDFVPWPEAPGPSWILVRQVRARGPAYRLADELTRATAAEVQSGDADNVVRFASLADLLAALLTDLVRGQAAGRWYWRRWSYLFRLPVYQAMQQLLTEHLSQLPSVCARLARQQTLTEVWLTLDEAGAGQLLQEMARRAGFKLPDSRQVEAALMAPGVEGPLLLPLPQGNSLRLQWAPVLRALSATDARFQLALALIGQQIAPLMLLQAPATLLARLTKAFNTVRTPLPQSRPLNPAASRSRDEATRAPAPSPEIATPAVSDAAADENGKAESRLDAANDAAQQFSHPKQRDPATARLTGAFGKVPGTQTAAATFEHGRTSSDAISIPGTDVGAPAASIRHQDPPQPGLRFAPPDPDFIQITTAQGGLLYLLNFLNRPQAQTLLGQYWEQLPSGWGWLYHLGQALQLDESDPIVPFIATQLGLEQAAELDQLPPLPARLELLDLARRWYGDSKLWQPDLLHLNARILSSPSHLDLYAPLATVRLPVRLAGLDIDPGWLPWLGRVVSFHYE